LGFDSLSGAKNHNSAIENAQAAFDFCGEVDVTWGIEQVDGALFPTERHASGEDRDTALLLFWIVIGFGCSRVDGPCAVFGTAHVEHLFGHGGFTGIDVSDDADISKIECKSRAIVQQLLSVEETVKANRIGLIRPTP